MRTRRLAVRLIALAVLVLGIVVMHHVARSDHGGSSGYEASTMTAVSVQAAGHEMGADVAGGQAADTENDAPSAAHDLLHLCLAVMTAVVLILVGWLLLARRPWLWMSAVAAFRALPMPPRAPPRPHGSALLTSLCVMRT